MERSRWGCEGGSGRSYGLHAPESTLCGDALFRPGRCSPGPPCFLAVLGSLMPRAAVQGSADSALPAGPTKQRQLHMTTEEQSRIELTDPPSSPLSRPRIALPRAAAMSQLHSPHTPLLRGPPQSGVAFSLFHMHEWVGSLA